MRWVIIYLMVLFNLHGFSQVKPDFKSLRYDEDYSYLRSDTNVNFYTKLKFSGISKNYDSYISYGGELRGQYFYVKNEEWGDAPPDSNGYMLVRSLIHADIHAGRMVRAFAQLQSSLAFSRIDPSPVEENPLEVHQAFIDGNIPLANSYKLTARIGRQELLYGSQRLVSVREGPNNRQSFDAMRVIFVGENKRADLFYGNHVIASKNVFDEGVTSNTKLWGAYLVFNRIKRITNADLYYLGLNKRAAFFDDGEGKEMRNSIGCRIWSNDLDWNYDFETLYQFGKLGGKNISAWTASLNTSLKFLWGRLRSIAGLKTELISGDRHYGDDIVQTFNPLFPRGAYFGLAALIGPANLIDVHPSLSVSILKGLELVVDYDVFWRFSKNDGLYGVNGALIYSGKNINAKYVGEQVSFNAAYLMNSFVSLTAEFTWFDAGPFLKSAGSGKDILFSGITVQFKF